MRRTVLDAQQSAAQAIKGKTVRERRAAQQLQDTHRDLAATREVRDMSNILQHEQLCACPHVLACLVVVSEA